MFSFYLQTFTVVQCGFLVSRSTCTNCKLLRPKSYESCPNLWSQPLLLLVLAVLPNFQEEGEGGGTSSLTCPHTEKCGGGTSGDRGGQAIVSTTSTPRDHKQHCALSSPAYNCMTTGRISKQLCTSGMPSSGLN